MRLSVLENDERIDGSAESLAVQQVWLDALRSYADRWDPGFGHIAYGYGVGATALEDCLPRGTTRPSSTSPQHTVNECRRLLRGYSWLTIVPRSWPTSLAAPVC
ncbi:hypothetical protein GCM10027614_73570 [Micromonospora vulcania]